MKNFVRCMALLLTVLTVLSGCGGGVPAGTTAGHGNADAPEEAAFEPKLDTTMAVKLDAAVFFGNFEAFDQVINQFNEYYPNVTIEYERYSDTMAEDFLTTNSNIDVLMTSNERGYPTKNCVDLLAAGVDVSAADDNIIAANKRGGVLYALPMSLYLKGLVVNKTLLAKEGLTVPQTYAEFIGVLDALKQKGYTPIQGPNAAVSSLFYDMGMSMMANDTALYKAAEAGDAAGAAALKTVYTRLGEFIDKGYIDTAVNATYPDDNYDGAILRFFEGEVPFWVCDTEKASGMKKRESKSEAFTASPIDYEFMYAPLGEGGAYKYIEPWYGFAVNKNSDVADYAVEFLRFMARGDALNTLASVKGVPSIAKVTSDAKYDNLGSTKTELSAVNDGTVSPFCGTLLMRAAEALLNGTEPDADGAFTLFLTSCKEIEWDY